MIPAKKPIERFWRVNLDGLVTNLQVHPELVVMLGRPRQQEIVDVDGQHESSLRKPEVRREVLDRLSASQQKSLGEPKTWGVVSGITCEVGARVQLGIHQSFRQR